MTTTEQQTLEQQLDGLIAEHGLTAVGLTRIARKDGTCFWAIDALQDAYCGSNRGAAWGSADTGLTAAIADLNTKRTTLVVVPELALIGEMVE